MQQHFPQQRTVSQKDEHRLCGGVGESKRVPFYSMDWESMFCLISEEK